MATRGGWPFSSAAALWWPVGKSKELDALSRSDDHFEEFGGHTLLKHRILQTYLAAWAFKLLQGQRNRDGVHFVDAFAGEGQDKKRNPGSPLIAAKIASNVAGKLRPGPPVEQCVFAWAIENNQGRFDNLEACLKRFGPPHPGYVKTRFGELRQFIDQITEATGDSATLYFLDPFGIKGLDATTYPKALRGPQNEIFALFADMGASRLYGLVDASVDLEARLHEIQSSPSLFPEEDQRAETVLIRDAEAYQRALDASQPAARQHLTAALGGTEWEQALAGQQPLRRGAIFLGLFIRKLMQAGARFVMTMPMRDEGGAKVYSLVHASKSETALLTMKEAVSNGLKNGPLPVHVAAKIREDLAVPNDVVIAFLRHRFAGRVLLWSDVVRPAMLASTPVFNFQTDAIRKHLLALGWIERTPKGAMKVPIVCRIPAQDVTNSTG